MSFLWIIHIFIIAIRFGKFSSQDLLLSFFNIIFESPLLDLMFLISCLGSNDILVIFVPHRHFICVLNLVKMEMFLFYRFGVFAVFFKYLGKVMFKKHKRKLSSVNQENLTRVFILEVDD